MRLGMALLAVAVLSGCGEQAYIQYQGRDAQTALECQAGYEAAKDAADNTVVAVPNNGAGLLAVVLTAGVINGSRESAYEQCLARVAILQPGGVTGAAPAPLQSMGAGTVAPVATRPAGCTPGAGPFQGGTGYCIGR
ncbi:MAG: hypothetical protein ACRCS3_12715 [Paracoccaceae bacterium]